MRKNLSNFKFLSKKAILTLTFLGLTIIGQSQTTDLFFEQTNEFLKKNLNCNQCVAKAQMGPVIYQ